MLSKGCDSEIAPTAELNRFNVEENNRFIPKNIPTTTDEVPDSFPYLQDAL